MAIKSQKSEFNDIKAGTHLFRIVGAKTKKSESGWEIVTFRLRSLTEKATCFVDLFAFGPTQADSKKMEWRWAALGDALGIDEVEIGRSSLAASLRTELLHSNFLGKFFRATIKQQKPRPGYEDKVRWEVSRFHTFQMDTSDLGLMRDEEERNPVSELKGWGTPLEVMNGEGGFGSGGGDDDGWGGGGRTSQDQGDFGDDDIPF